MSSEKNVSVIMNHDNALTSSRQFSPSQLQTIRQTVAKDTSTTEFNMFMEICRRQGLDPFRRQIHCIVYNKDDAAKRQVVMITGIDGYRSIANRSGTYRPDENEPVYETDATAKSAWNPSGIISCTVQVMKYGPDRQWHPIKGVARWDEYAPIGEGGKWVPIVDEQTGEPVLETEGKYKGKPKKRKQGDGNKYLTKDNWKNMPFLMIAKCAEANALRKGWPEDFGSLYVAEEFDRANVINATATEVVEEYEKEQRMAMIGANDTVPMLMALSTGLERIPISQVYDKVMETLQGFESASDIAQWQQMNSMGLNEFWARSKTDALALKKEIEILIAQKARAASQPQNQTHQQGAAHA